MKRNFQELFLLLVVSTFEVLDLANGCPQSCRCQDNPIDSVLFVACEGITTGDTLKEIASTIPKNTTGLAIEHFDYWLFLTQEFPVLLNLRILNIQSGIMREIPRYMGQYFPGLQSLYISKTEIEKITPEYFLNLDNLTSLNLNNNYIGMIKSGAFKHAKNLTTLILNSNRIKKISTKALHGLTKLSIVNLKGNDLKYVKPGTFNITQSTKDTATFTEINLAGNRIKKLPNGLFAGVRAVKILNLQNNFINQIEEEAFHGVEMIFELKLARNFLTGIPTSSITWCKNSNMSIKRAHTNVISLDLRENPIHCDCPLIHLFANLRRTNMNSNIQVVCKSPKQFYNQPFYTKFFPAKFQSCLVPAPLRW